MSSLAPESDLQSAIARMRRIASLQFDNEQLRAIAGDESADDEKRAIALDLINSRCCVGLLLALLQGGAQ